MTTLVTAAVKIMMLLLLLLLLLMMMMMMMMAMMMTTTTILMLLLVLVINNEGLKFESDVFNDNIVQSITNTEDAYNKHVSKTTTPSCILMAVFPCWVGSCSLIGVDSLIRLCGASERAGLIKLFPALASLRNRLLINKQNKYSLIYVYSCTLFLAQLEITSFKISPPTVYIAPVTHISIQIVCRVYTAGIITVIYLSYMINQISYKFSCKPIRLWHSFDTLSFTIK